MISKEYLDRLIEIWRKINIPEIDPVKVIEEKTDLIREWSCKGKISWSISIYISDIVYAALRLNKEVTNETIYTILTSLGYEVK